MSKGGAGKVYFVLYLAVILELLIIFIERDEAEEHLRRQQREAIQIVQTILSQLQTGAGVSAITTRPKDNITLDDKEPESTVRVYDVLVAVGDSNSISEMSNGERIKGDDIPELLYKVSHVGDPNIPEEELPLDTADLADPFFIAKLGTDNATGSDKREGYFRPTQVKGTAAPTGDPTAYFQLNEEMTAQELAKGRRVKVFRVNFKPTQSEGWYRLRFESKTNQIMGVIGGEPSDNDTIRIGNVKLTVKQLRSVQKFLEKEKDDPNQQVVLEYINKLLNPDEWPFLPGNQGANAIDVRVVRPDEPPPAEPVARINFPRQDIYWYTGATFDVPVTVGPSDGGSWRANYGNIVKDAETGKYELVMENPPVGELNIELSATNGAGQQATDAKILHVEKPQLTIDPRRLRPLRATIGSKYLPETEWVSTQIPPEHYLTEVKFDDKMVFSRRGTTFDPRSLPEELVVPSSVNEIRMTVYWLPNGDESRKVAILTTDGSVNPIVAEYKFNAVKPNYKAPTYDGEFEFTFPLNGKKWDVEFEGIRASQVVGPGRTAGVRAIEATCDECAEYGLSQPRVSQIDETRWKLYMEVADKKKVAEKAREINGKKFLIQLKLIGMGSDAGTAAIDMTVRIGG